MLIDQRIKIIKSSVINNRCIIKDKICKRICLRKGLELISLKGLGKYIDHVRKYDDPIEEYVKVGIKTMYMLALLLSKLSLILKNSMEVKGLRS